MRRSTIGLAVFTSALIILALAPSVVVAQVGYTIKAGNNNDKNSWQLSSNVGGAICVTRGDRLIFQNPSGTWQDGNSTTAAFGSMKSWPDNFLNLLELGKVGPYEARNSMQYWDALVGYIGDPVSSPPPQRGSYAAPYNPKVAAAAQLVFPVFPQLKTPSVFVAQDDGCLFLAFNADAYSNYVADNSGSVTVSVTWDSGYLQRLGNPDLSSVCQVFSGLVLNAVCWAADQLTGGSGPSSSNMTGTNPSSTGTTTNPPFVTLGGQH